MLAAVAQICSKASVTDNAAVCASVIRRAADAGAALVALPEASDFIAPSHQVHSLTATTEDAFVRILQQQARTSRIEVTVGVHEAIADSRQVYNTQLFINRDGEVAQSYRKCHLFDVDIKGGTTILESATTRAGESLGDPIASGIGQLGLMTCYDLRFPMQSLLMRAKGAQVMTYPSAFTERTGAAHWEVLLRARAIETQSYVLAPAQVGSHFAPRAEEANGKQIIRPGRTSYGHSMIVDPWGSVVAQCADNVSTQSDTSSVHSGAFALAEIDLDWAAQIRREMPILQQQRKDIYSLTEI